jgi:chemotaxis family two-component system sensor kinase Cph1
MEVLLGGLLRLSRVGSAVLKPERLDMNKILAEVIENFKQQIAEKKVLVEIEKLPECMGDASLIKEVFSNLLNNALIYLADSRRGRVTIWGKVEDGQSVYCVEDNGIGIGRENYEKIFDMFYHLEGDRKRGEGLGLTVARRILERHKGRIWVASEVGKGSRFYVSLPRA